MRALITGSRDWECPELAEDVLHRLVAKHGQDIVLVHGDCPTGVDRCFDDAARLLSIPCERHPADWDRDGKAAGPIRNSAMVATGPDLCLAFSRDIRASRGTRDCAGKAHAAGIPTWLTGEDGVPRRWGLLKGQENKNVTPEDS